MKEATEKNTALARALVALGLLLALGMSSAAFILGMQAKGIGANKDTITVKGLAEKPVKADYAEWRVGVSVKSEDFAGALQALRAERAKLDAFIAQQGFGTESLKIGREQVSPYYVEKELPNGNTRTVQEGYQAEQDIVIHSQDLNKIITASSAAIEFEAAGNQIRYSDPNYLLSNLEEIKMSLINDATKNARERANEFVKDGNARIGAMRSASQGAFYILREGTSVDTADYGGIYDKSTINKMARVVVTIQYSIQD